MVRKLTQKLQQSSGMTQPHEIFITARAGLVFILCIYLAFFSSAAFSQDKGFNNAASAGWPIFWRPFDPENPPSTQKYKVLTFVVDSSHPPFSYKDASGRLTGFSVELARLICQDYGLTCRFETASWQEIPTQLIDGRAEVAIASLRISQKTREDLVFTNRFFVNPARFIALKTNMPHSSSPQTLSGEDIAVIKGTAHEAFLKKYYPDSDIQSYDTREQALTDLRSNEIDLFFSDGVSLSFWMQSNKAAQCCRFVKGAYIQREYFGEGIGFSVAKKNAKLAKIIDFGLEKLRRAGVLERLYRVYFPTALY